MAAASQQQWAERERRGRVSINAAAAYYMYKSLKMAARRSAAPWGEAEVRYLVEEMEKHDYFSAHVYEHPVLHKQAILRRIKRALASKFSINRSTTQIRKKIADLHYRSRGRVENIRSRRASHHENPSTAELVASVYRAIEALQAHRALLMRSAAAEGEGGSRRY